MLFPYERKELFSKFSITHVGTHTPFIRSPVMSGDGAIEADSSLVGMTTLRRTGYQLPRRKRALNRKHSGERSKI